MILLGSRVRLRTVEKTDLPKLVEILSIPEVAQFWSPQGEFDVSELLSGEDEDGAERVSTFVIEVRSKTVGWIQGWEKLDRDYRHAGIDLFLAPSHHGQGFGPEAIRLVAKFLFEERAHHRIVIDPAAHNERAIRAYEKVGFRRVGVMRRYERGADGRYHDGLLMDMLPEDLR